MVITDDMTRRKAALGDDNAQTKVRRDELLTVATSIYSAQCMGRAHGGLPPTADAMRAAKALIYRVDNDGEAGDV